VIILPHLGLGVVCATNAWSIFDQDTILPMAIEVIKVYARTALNRPEPRPAVSKRVPMPTQIQGQVAGLYASCRGVYRVRSAYDHIKITSDTLDGILEYAGRNQFQSGPDGPIAKVAFTPPDALSLVMRNGMVIEAQKRRSGPDTGLWLKRLGTYRIAKAGAGALYAFSLGSFEGLPVICGDDGIELQLEPLSGERAVVTCDESSRFFGKEIRISRDQGLLLDGLLYVGNTPVN
jgi:hypothetical protein